MSSRYSCIITNEPIEVPEEMPHFSNRGVLTIPMDVKEDDVSEFLKFFKNEEIVIPDHFITEHSEDSSPDIDDDCEYVFGKSEEILKILTLLDLTFKKFIILYDSDFADIPTEQYHGAFDGGNIVEGTYYSSDDKEKTNSSDNAFQYLGVTYNDICLFNAYGDAAVEYVENTFKPGLWR